MRHEYLKWWPNVKGIGVVQVCKLCGIMRRPQKGIFHYYRGDEHIGVGEHNSCPGREEKKP